MVEVLCFVKSILGFGRKNHYATFAYVWKICRLHSYEFRIGFTVSEIWEEYVKHYSKRADAKGLRITKKIIRSVLDQACKHQMMMHSSEADYYIHQHPLCICGEYVYVIGKERKEKKIGCFRERDSETES